LHEYEIEILKLLKEQSSAELPYLEGQLKLGRDSIVWALENLAKSNAVIITRKSTYGIEISDEGRSYLKQFPEESLVKALGKGSSMPLEKIKDKIGLIWAKKNGWIEITGKDAKLSKEGQAVAEGHKEYATRKLLNDLDSASGEALERLLASSKEPVQLLSNRNLLVIKKGSEITDVSITKSGSTLLEQEAGKGIGQLTREIIKSREWQREGLRGYDINAPTEPEYAARLHPMHELIDKIRRIWISMGFIEVSGPVIESAFWDFDALFVPQDHPAREMQDTFFLSNPKTIDIDDLELLGRIKEMHEKGWQEVWRDTISKQALLRTHTTATTMRHLRKFVLENGSYEPIKIFSVGKVFRNESIDYKHLAELYQSDGIVIGEGLTLAHLIGILKSYYGALGIKARVKPAYYPFVEPGLDVYYYDERLGKTIELCGSGIIRKEITNAMGTTKTVLAWGPGVERIALKLMNIDSVTELYNNNMGWLRNRKGL
jgi:phenylalanyl-tRNA synthetase alpha chain